MKRINIKEMVREKVVGGKADNKDAKDIAKKHGVPVEDILRQIQKGIKVEMEHTDDREIATEISKDHLMEYPYYYDDLAKMEDKEKKKMGEKGD